MSVQIFIKIRS